MPELLKWQSLDCQRMEPLFLPARSKSVCESRAGHDHRPSPMTPVRRYIGARSGVTDVNRELELRIKGHLYELDKLDTEYVDTKQGFHSAEQGYSRTLESVADCAGTEMVDRVAENIKEHIRNEGERPDNKSIRRDARMLLSEEGIVADEYLNRA